MSQPSSSGRGLGGEVPHSQSSPRQPWRHERNESRGSREEGERCGSRGDSVGERDTEDSRSYSPTRISTRESGRPRAQRLRAPTAERAEDGLGLRSGRVRRPRDRHPSAQLRTALDHTTVGLAPMLGRPGGDSRTRARLLRPLSNPRSAAPLRGRDRDAGRRRIVVERRPTSRQPLRRTSNLESDNAPSEETCHSFCFAAGIDVGKLHANWMTMKREAAAASRGGPQGADIESGDEPQVRAQLNYVVTLNQEIVLLLVGSKECFAFHFGCLVCWGCTPEEANVAVGVVKLALIDPLPPTEVEEDYIAIGGEAWQDCRVMLESDSLAMHLFSSDSAKEWKTFERVSLAYALAQSVRLGSLELRIHNRIAETRSIPETIAQERRRSPRALENNPQCCIGGFWAATFPLATLGDSCEM
eukprot:4164515-Amphidinium_carterae.2